MRHAVYRVDAAILEPAALLQLKAYLPGHRVEQRNPGAEQHGMDVETEAVDDAGLEQRSRELAAAHDADAAAVLLLEASHEFTGVFADDGDARLVLRKRARE